MPINIDHTTDDISNGYNSAKVNGSKPQPELVSGTNIKTVNGNSLLGSGNLTVGADTSTFVTKDSSTGAASLPVGTTAQRPATPAVGMIRYNSTLKVNEVYTESQITAGTFSWRAIPTGDTIIQASTNGEATYTTPGTYSWTCPAGVTAVSVVCVGGGGGAPFYSSGGGGGGLAWVNNIPVTPGTAYTVVVGAGGAGSTSTGSTSPGGAGGASYFINSSTVYAGGGDGGGNIANASTAQGGTFVATSNYGTSGGGTGGSGGVSASVSYACGGGGAGGYTGSGGAGAYGSSSVMVTGAAGTGGGGGGGGNSTSSGSSGGAGGGTGIYGAGTSGTGGSGASGAPGTRGAGGSSGTGGTQTTAGGFYGGGAAAKSGTGGGGAVRIIWGPSRAFPSTNTGTL